MIPSAWVQKVMRITGVKGLVYTHNIQIGNLGLSYWCLTMLKREREREEGNIGTSMGDHMSNSQHFP